MIEVRPLTRELLPDLEALFNTSRETYGCWCMWFIIPYKEYHANGPEGNRQRFIDLMEATPFPIGLLAYREGEVVGWCAAGPRSRFVRALGVPSFKGRDPSEDDNELSLIHI